jgi:hypothetical protein
VLQIAKLNPKRKEAKPLLMTLEILHFPLMFLRSRQRCKGAKVPSLICFWIFLS